VSLYISIEHLFSGTEIVLANGDSVTGYTVQRDGTKLGDIVDNPMFSRNVDSLDVHVTGAPRGHREQQISLLVESATQAGLTSSLESLQNVAESITRKGGGVLRWRKSTGNEITRYMVSAAKVVGLGDIQDFESFYRMRVILALIVDPYGYGFPFTTGDDFSTDTLGSGGVYNLGGRDWGLVNGSLANYAVSAGQLVVTGSTISSIAHVGHGHTYNDGEAVASFRFTAATNSMTAGLIARRNNGATYLETSIVSNTSGGGIFRVRKFSAGVGTNLSTVAITNGEAGQEKNFWVVARVVGRVFTGEFWTTEPTPMGTPTDTLSYTMDDAEFALFGSGSFGYACNINSRYVSDDFRVMPYSHKSVELPSTLIIEKSWAGTLDARAAVHFSTSGGTPPHVMVMAWWPKPDAHNYVWNGAAECVGTSASTAYGWAHGASVLGAGATSVSRSTSVAYEGSASVEVVNPATDDAGARFSIYGRKRFRKGVKYTASCFARSASDTTEMVLKLGVDANHGESAASELTTAWQAFTVTWTPNADYDTAAVGLFNNEAEANTHQIDRVMVYEGVVEPSFTHGGFGPGIIPAAAYDSAKASVSSDGAYWTQTTDSDYLIGVGPQGTGAMTSTANLEFHILPHLFTPDDFTSGEVDVTVYARAEVNTDQDDLSCVISVIPEGGTDYGSVKYSENYDAGKAMLNPDSGTAFRVYKLGTVTLNIDRNNPLRKKLRMEFVNDLGTGLFGLDYIMLVPSRSMASSRTGALSSTVPEFVKTTAEVTKIVKSGLSVLTVNRGSTVSKSPVFDSSLLLNRIEIPGDDTEFLIAPFSEVVDMKDISAASVAKNHNCSVWFDIEPKVYLLA